MVIDMKWLCILASIIWGSNVVLMKSLLAETSPLVVACVRVVFSSGVIFLMGKMKKVDFRMDIGLVWPLFILGLLNVTLNFGLSFAGMKMVSGSSTAMINALSPVVIGILCWDRKMFLGMLFCIVGVLCSFHFDIFSLEWGHLLLLGSIACYAGSFLYAKRIKAEPMVKSFYAMLMGGMLLFVVSGELIWLDFSLFQWCLFLLISVIGFAYIQWVYFEASEKIGMEKTSFYMNLNPVFTYLGSIVFLNETVDFYQILGMILIVVGLFVSERKYLTKK